MIYYCSFILLYIPIKEKLLRSLDEKNKSQSSDSSTDTDSKQSKSSDSSTESEPPFVYPEVGPPFVYDWRGVCINGDPNRTPLDSIKEAGQWIGDVANKAWEKWCEWLHK